MNDKYYKNPKQLRSTHFLAIRINDSDVLEKNSAVCNEIIRKWPNMEHLAEPITKRHMSLFVLNIPTYNLIKSAGDILLSSKDLLPSDGLKLHVNGTNIFNNRILYATVEQNQVLSELVSKLYSKFSAANMTPEPLRFANPHITMFRSRASMFRPKAEDQLAIAAYEDYINMDYGWNTVKSIDLCMMGSTGNDGYYEVAASLSY